MKKLLVIICLGMLFILSCSKKAVIRNYYLVELTQNLNTIETAREQPFAFTLDVRDFQVAKAYEQTRIALRTETNELNYFYYHHWAVRPSYAFADQSHYIIDRLGLFQQVNRGFSYSPDYLLTGIVNNIERSHLDNQQSAHLAMTLQLVDAETGFNLVRYDFDRSVKLDKSKSMNAFASLISDIFYEEVLVFSHKVAEYLGTLKK